MREAARTNLTSKSRNHRTALLFYRPAHGTPIEYQIIAFLTTMAGNGLLAVPLFEEPDGGSGSDGGGDVTTNWADADAGGEPFVDWAAELQSEADAAEVGEGNEGDDEVAEYIGLREDGDGHRTDSKRQNNIKRPPLDISTLTEAPSSKHISFGELPDHRAAGKDSARDVSQPSTSPSDEEYRSDLFDWELVRDRLEQLRTARESGDMELSLFLIRTTLQRDVGGIMSPELYASPHPGPLKLISDYIEEVVTHLNYLADVEWSIPMTPSTPTTGSPNSLANLPLSAKHSFFLSLQRAYGRTALLLSGGATLGLMHLGVIRILSDEKLLPRVMSGASVGSVISAMVCTKTDAELPRLFEPSSLNLQTFTGPGEGLYSILHRITSEGVLYDVEVLLKALRDNIGELTFSEAFNKTRRILNITVSPGSTFEMPRVLNYLSSPAVIIWSAVAASCAIPGVYNSAPLLAKDKSGKVIPWNPTGHRWIDGSVENDLPIARISELFGVNHFLVSQVNPHVVPFLSSSSVQPLPLEIFGSIANAMENELSHRLSQFADLGIFPRLLRRTVGLLKQRYTGDVTIVPEVRVTDYLKLMINPTEEDLVEYRTRGERATLESGSLRSVFSNLPRNITLPTLFFQKYPRSEIASQLNSPSTKSSTASVFNGSNLVRRLLQTRPLRASTSPSDAKTKEGAWLDLVGSLGKTGSEKERRMKTRSRGRLELRERSSGRKTRLGRGRRPLMTPQGMRFEARCLDEMSNNFLENRNNHLLKIAINPTIKC